MKIGVVVFPGSNCDDDMVDVLSNVYHKEVRKIWHKDTDLSEFSENDCIVLPGGFSYGDYLRCGAIAKYSPIMQSVIRFAESGGYVFGVCNGFQILCESGLLPGALLVNANQKFICKNIYLKSQTSNTPFTCNLKEGEILKVPIAHADGRYYADPDTLAQLEANHQILFKYCDGNGNISTDTNVNGSVNNIAGICNVSRNVLGMMPHPERAAESILGNTDGKKIFDSFFSWVEQHAKIPVMG